MTKRICVKDKVFELLISEATVKNKIKELAIKIKTDYSSLNPVFISVLNGSFIFAADLLREIKIDCEINFVQLQSYNRDKPGKFIKEIYGIVSGIENRDVIIIEDIIDSGRTVNFLIGKIRILKPKSLKIVSLLYKTNSVFPESKLDYTGFKISGGFVIGYGLDYDGFGRNLKSIYSNKIAKDWLAQSI